MADAGGTVLTWNMTNWLSVILMAGIGFALLGLGMKVWQNRVQGSGAA